MPFTFDVTLDVHLAKGDARMRYQIEPRSTGWLVTVAVLAPVAHASMDVVLTSDAILERYAALHREIDILVQNGWTARTVNDGLQRSGFRGKDK
jgi:hypothetical protein